jgi:hypothetical protein
MPEPKPKKPRMKLQSTNEKPKIKDATRKPKGRTINSTLNEIRKNKNRDKLSKKHRVFLNSRSKKNTRKESENMQTEGKESPHRKFGSTRMFEKLNGSRMFKSSQKIGSMRKVKKMKYEVVKNKNSKGRPY